MSSRKTIGRIRPGATPRAPVCVRALVDPHQSEPTEHLTFDISVAGIQLCGHPEVKVGDEARVRLYFSQTAIAQVSGEILRLTEIGGRPVCAIRLESVLDENREIIQKTADAALLGNPSPSVLLLDPVGNSGSVQDWLTTLRARCRVVQHIGKLAETFTRYPIETVVVDPVYREVLAEWAAGYSHVSWRSLDDEGQLHR